MNTAPVVLFIFNRPEVTARVFARIRDSRPADLLVVGDAARPDRPGEEERVQKTRETVLDGIDWPCRVQTDFARQNLGCRRRVSSGLGWAFERVPAAIILEDDCLPDPSFFGFCSTLLERHRTDPGVLHVNGTNLAPGPLPGGAAYRFSRHAWMWGWAGWARAWKHYDASMATWDERVAAVRETFATAWEARYWLSTWDRARRDPEQGNTWDFQWQYSVRAVGGYTLVPAMNLVRNLGFGPDATHTTGDTLRHLSNAASPSGPLRAPRSARIDLVAEERFTRAYAGVPPGLVAELRTRARILRERIRRGSLVA
jgi:hypothetical protein